MGERILVPVDGSERSTEGLEYALERFPDGIVTALHVKPLGTRGDLNSFSGLTEVVAESEDVDAAAREVLEEAKRVADEHGVEIDTATARGRADRVIVTYADKEGFDLIVIGSHGREGVARVLLGSVAERVVRRSPIPVLVYR